MIAGGLLGYHRMDFLKISLEFINTLETHVVSFTGKVNFAKYGTCVPCVVMY